MEQFDGSFRLAGSRDSLNATFYVANGSLRVTAGEFEIGTWPLNEVRLASAGDGIHILVEGEDLVVKMRDPGGFTEAVGIAAPPRDRPKRRLMRQPHKSERPADKRPTEPRPAAKVDEPDDDVTISHVRLQPKPAPVEVAPVAADPVPAPVAPPPPAPVPTAPVDVEPFYVPVQPKAAPPKQPLSRRVREARDVIEWKEWRRRLSIPAVRWSLAFFGVILLVLIAVFATGTLGMLLTLIGMVSLILAALAVSDDPSVYRFLPARITETMLLAVGFVCLGLGLPLIFLA